MRHVSLSFIRRVSSKILPGRSPLPLLAFAAGMVLSAPSFATVLTFEGIVASNSDQIPATPYSEGGFTLTGSNGDEGIFGASSDNTDGTAVYGFCLFNGCGTTILLTATGGGPFSLNQLAAADLETGDGASTIELLGNIAGGGTVEQVLNVSTTWTTFSIAGFSNLTSVELIGTGNFNPAIDNVTLNAAVPEPGSFALMGAGLASLGLLRRREKA